MIFTLAQEAVANPQTWANIAERLGIPFAILLLIFFWMAAVAIWFAKNVIKPVTKAHVSFVEAVRGTQVEIKENSKKSIEQNVSIIDIAKTHKDAFDKHDREVLERLERMSFLLAKEAKK